VTAKIHALVDAAGLPIALKLTESDAHHGRSAEDMLVTLANHQRVRNALYRSLGDRSFNRIKYFRVVATGR
jgi:transposase